MANNLIICVFFSLNYFFRQTSAKPLTTVSSSTALDRPPKNKAAAGDDQASGKSSGTMDMQSGHLEIILNM